MTTTPDPVIPSLEEILVAHGVALDKAKADAMRFAQRFPDGIIPAEAIEAWLDEYFSEAVIRNALAAAAQAWAQFAATGRGPVGPVTGAELA